MKKNISYKLIFKGLLIIIGPFIFYWTLNILSISVALTLFQSLSIIPYILAIVFKGIFSPKHGLFQFLQLSWDSCLFSILISLILSTLLQKMTFLIIIIFLFLWPFYHLSKSLRQQSFKNYAGQRPHDKQLV